MNRRVAWIIGTAMGTMVAGGFWSSAPVGLSLTFAGWCCLLLPTALVLAFVRVSKAGDVAAGLVAGGIAALLSEGSGAAGLAWAVVAAGLFTLALRLAIGALRSVGSRGADTTRATAAA